MRASTRKRLRELASRVDFSSERYYHIELGPAGKGQAGGAQPEAAETFNLLTYQTELNRLRIEFFRLQRNVENLRLPAIEAVGLDEYAAELSALKRELHSVAKGLSELATIEPLKSALEGLLDVADSCDRVVALAEDESAKVPESVLTGVRSIRDQLLSRLARFGIERMEPGERFDPAQHLALSTVTDPEKPNGTIAQIVLAGYKQHGKVLRPAQVVVVKNP
ncbi:MAG: nucleotide exchange factor GrpE [Planctomycetales bacterium 4484_113]|nr:MAG: nucleotide exchange factor GrpE [Planctomycetales bacterium 4484_113]